MKRDTTVEYVKGPEDTAEIRQVVLFVDKKTDRLGIEGKDGGRYQVPLSHVLDLLRRGVM